MAMDESKRAVGRVNRTEEQWRVLLSRFATSGMSAREFCRAEKVSESSFHRRRGTLGNAAAQGAFVDVGAMSNAEVAGKQLELRIDLGDGLVLTLVRH
jgi:hypothetical protein